MVDSLVLEMTKAGFTPFLPCSVVSDQHFVIANLHRNNTKFTYLVNIIHEKNGLSYVGLICLEIMHLRNINVYQDVEFRFIN